MSAMMNSTAVSDFGPVRRIQLDQLKGGETICKKNGLTNKWEMLGIVVSVEREIGTSGTGIPYERTSRVTLDNGKNMTRRGWQSRRLWRLVSE